MKTERITISQIDEIGDFIKDFASKLSHDLAEQAEEDMVNAHHEIIEDFYNSYSPTSYKRRKDLYDTLSLHKIYSTSTMGLNRYRAKIVVDSSELSEHFRIDAKNVWNLMWIHGVRGLPPKGNNPLEHTYYWKTSIGYIRFMKGMEWINFDWNLEKHKNLFGTNINNELDTKHKPHFAMKKYIEQWGQKHGIKKCEETVKKIVK